MTTAIDSNVIVALMNPDDTLNRAVQTALNACARGQLVIPAPAFAELLAGPSRTEAFLDKFFADARITVEWELDEMVWRTAGRSFRSYVARRSRNKVDGPRQILTDFLIGAFAMRHGYQLLTLDKRRYRAAFPDLKILVA